MDITDVKIFPVEEDKLRAYVTITLDGCFVVRDLKVISGAARLAPGEAIVGRDLASDLGVRVGDRLVNPE